MEYNHSSAKEKWTIMMYMRDFDLMVTYAYALRSSNELTSDNIDDILMKMEEDGVYRPRNGGSTFTGQFKSIQIAWYMFGYYNKSRRRDEEKKMVFSPLGNLLLSRPPVSHLQRKFLTLLPVQERSPELHQVFPLPLRMRTPLLRCLSFQGKVFP